ncbi:BNR repeat-containing protein [Arcticibacter eurypsychrophilus]|uniref:BNR repeat-containing protein n=1 Tax=Arcticibacter eurypsychrophilus TaxID=1434752 RepID=UPI00084DB4C6|nr:BNR repeat-containing protein [Arcticibacter eurypsychrophilus]
MIRIVVVFLVSLFLSTTLYAQSISKVKVVSVADGWANNSVNAVIFRKNSLVTHKLTQYIAFYDKDRYVVLGKRKLGTKKWKLKQTRYQGNTSDAHNTISIIVDGEGYLHIAWDHHDNALRYCRSISPGSLELTEKLPMAGSLEEKVAYPEFYTMKDGNLLFFYRNGQSGKGNLVINRYDTASKKWSQLHSDLIDGEGKRNAYWQANIDQQGTIHISWVWRESPDVASNHDMCYARSKDGGKTWEKSTSEKYILPITAVSAEYASKIPQNSELINQTSMTADSKGNPFIATYYRIVGSAIPQYHIIYHDGTLWKDLNLGFRQIPFSLKGGGTKRIPISRPQVFALNKGKRTTLALLFRDEERGSKVSIAICKDLQQPEWRIKDLSLLPVDSWEPSYDTELWKKQHKLHIFVQRVEQVDGEGKADVPPSAVQVLETDIN